MTSEKVACATVSPHLHVLPHILQVQFPAVSVVALRFDFPGFIIIELVI